MAASPHGWHETGTLNPGHTDGNNVVSYKGVTQAGPLDTTAQSSPNDNYNYTYNAMATPGDSPNVDAARVNAFYVANMVHDLTVSPRISKFPLY